MFRKSENDEIYFNCRGERNALLRTILTFRLDFPKWRGIMAFARVNAKCYLCVEAMDMQQKAAHPLPLFFANA